MLNRIFIGLGSDWVGLDLCQIELVCIRLDYDFLDCVVLCKSLLLFVTTVLSVVKICS